MKLNSVFKELAEELQLVFFKKYKLVDFLLPPLTFLVAGRLFGQDWGLGLSLCLLLAMLLLRLLKGESLTSLSVGFLGVLVAYGYTLISGNLTGFFLPDIVTDGLIALVCLVSIVIKKPLVAYTSFVSRRWPLGWYWHPRVRPAYSQVTFFWSLFFAFKFVLGLIIFFQGGLEKLALANILTGWPATLILLVLSYLYGLRRLKVLKGPSVKEFKNKQKPPWKGQERGF